MESDEPASNAGTPTPETPSPAPPEKSDFWRSFFEKAATTGRLAGKEAQRRKLQSVDLRKADQEIGRKALERESVPNQFGETVAKVKEIREQIVALRQPEEAKGDSFTDKAKAAATAAAKKAKIEGLKIKENNLLAELGAKIRGQSKQIPSLDVEVAAASAIKDRIQSIDAEIESLRSQSWVKRPLLLISIAVVLLALIFGVRAMRTRRSDTSSSASIAAEMERYQRDVRDGQIQAEKNRQAQLDSVKQIMAMTEKSQREYQEKQRQEEEAQRKEEEERGKQEAREREQAQIAQKKKEDAERAERENQRREDALAQERASHPTPTPNPLSQTQLPWTTGKEAAEHVVIYQSLWNVVTNKEVMNDLHLWSGDTTTVSGHPNVLFCPSENKFLPGFSTAAPHLVIPGSNTTIAPPIDTSSSSKAASYIARDFRRMVIIENGDVWRGEFDWSKNEVVNKKRLTTTGLFNGKSPVLWFGNTLYIDGRFSKEKPIVKIDLLTGKLEEIPDYSAFGSNMFVNPPADLVFRPDGEILHTYDARAGVSRVVRNTFQMKVKARTSRCDILTYYSKPEWIDADTLACIVEGTPGDRAIVKLNVRTGSSTLLEQRPGHYRDLVMLPEHRVLEVVHDSDQYDNKVAPWCHLIDVADGRQTKVPYGPEMRRKWLTDDVCLFGKTTGGIEQIGTWTFNRSTGETKKLCSIPFDGAFAMLLPERQEVCFSEGTNGQHLCRVKLTGEDFVQLDCGEYARVVGPIPVDLGLDAPGKSPWERTIEVAAVPNGTPTPAAEKDKPGDWFVVMETLKDAPAEDQAWAKNAYDYIVSNLLLGNFYDPAKLTLKLLKLHHQQPKTDFAVLVMNGDYKECVSRANIEQYAYLRTFKIFSNKPSEQVERIAQAAGRWMADAYLADPLPTENQVERLFRGALNYGQQHPAGDSPAARSQPQPNASPSTSTASAPTNSESWASEPNDAAAEFARRTVEGMSNHDLDALVGLYADGVDYLDKGRINAWQLQKEFEQYFERWPETSWQMSAPVTIKSVEPNKFKFTFSVSYVASNFAANKHVTGEAQETMVAAKDAGGGYKIVWQRERTGAAVADNAPTPPKGKVVKGQRYHPNDAVGKQETADEIARRLRSLFPR